LGRELVKEIRCDVETPVSLFLKLKRLGANILLESAEGGEHWGRYSFIGFGEPLFTFENADDKAFDKVKKFLKQPFKSLSIPSSPPFMGGLIGYLSYDAVVHLEPVMLPEEDLMKVPQLVLMKVDKLAVLDNLKGSILLVDRKEGQKGIKMMQGAINSPLENTKKENGGKIEIISTFTPDAFKKAVSRAVEYVRAGDVIQVVLAQILQIKCDIEPFSLYRALRHVNPSPYMFFLDIGDIKLIGSSPEVMVRLQGDLAETRPIAGTRPRGATAEKERELEEELLNDPKERAEHVMLVDLARNDLGRVAEMGSVEVTSFMEIERYSHVLHLVSHVKAKLKKEYDAIDLLKATFPAGTLSGAPKVRAMQIISELEPTKRGFYGGCVGYFGYEGNMDTCIAIRSLLYKEGIYYLGVGAGIVADSQPEREYEETINKAKGMIKALELAKEGGL